MEMGLPCLRYECFKGVKLCVHFIFNGRNDILPYIIEKITCDRLRKIPLVDFLWIEISFRYLKRNIVMLTLTCRWHAYCMYYNGRKTQLIKEDKMESSGQSILGGRKKLQHQFLVCHIRSQCSLAVWWPICKSFGICKSCIWLMQSEKSQSQVTIN